AFTLAFSYVTALSFMSIFGFLYFVSLFVEFFLALFLSWLILKYIVDFHPRSVILMTGIIGWFPASLVLTWTLGFFQRGYFDGPYYGGYNFFMYFAMATSYSLFHTLAYCVGALISTFVSVSYGERLKRKILFAVSRGGETVDLLKLAVNLEDDLPTVKDGVQRLIKEGSIVGHLDKASNKLHVRLTASLAPGLVPSAIQHSEGLVREYNIFKSLLKDLEDLRTQDRISSSSYDTLRQEYEHKLKLLESAMRESPT
ncbi:MAG: hypothetical protein JSV29_05035, partial [Candidatus Bathyarchaeota archaeon]